MVVAFDQEVHLLCEPTSDRREIYRAIRSTRISEGTSLYEAIDRVINGRLRGIEGRKAIILFTDGVDTSSIRSNDRANLDDAMELDALIYPVMYDTFADVQELKNRSLVSHPRPVPGSTPQPFPVPPLQGKPNPQGTTPEEYKKAELTLPVSRLARADAFIRPTRSSTWPMRTRRSPANCVSSTA